MVIVIKAHRTRFQAGKLEEGRKPSRDGHLRLARGFGMHPDAENRPSFIAEGEVVGGGILDCFPSWRQREYGRV